MVAPLVAEPPQWNSTNSKIHPFVIHYWAGSVNLVQLFGTLCLLYLMKVSSVSSIFWYFVEVKYFFQGSG